MKKPEFKYLAILASTVLAALAQNAKAQTNYNGITYYGIRTFDTPPCPWFNLSGGAFVSAAWDGTVNRTNGTFATNVNSGSMRLDYQFSVNPDQALLSSCATDYNPPLNGYLLTNFECDIMFAPGSPTNGANNFGQVIFGSPGNGWSQPTFGAVVVNVTNAGQWVHVSFPISAASQPAWATISDIFLGISTFGTPPVQTNVLGKLWFDNIAFRGFTTPPPPPPPVMGIQKATPGLRMFNRDSQAPWNAQGFSSVDQYQSWTAQSAGQHPAYTIDVQSWNNTPASQVLQMIFIPTNTAASVGSPYVGFFSTNTVTWTIQNFITNFVSSIAWKTNASAAGNVTNWNVVTNIIGIGKWTLTWLDDNNATITPPGGSPAAFTLQPGVSYYMADPLEFVVSINPNAVAGYGEYLDLSGVYVTNVAGVNEFDDFTRDDAGAPGTIGAPGYWNTDYSFSGGVSLVQVAANDPFWVTWSYPDIGYSTNLETAPSITTPATNWYSPGYYANSNPVTTTLMANKTEWTLLSVSNLPTSNLTPGGPVSPQAYFRLSTNAPTH